MKNNKSPDAIVHDAYFNKPPKLVLLLLVRLALLCLLSASVLLSTCDIYSLNEYLPIICGTAAGMTAVLFLLFSFFPSNLVCTVLIGGTGLTLWLLRKQLIEKLSFFADYMLLRLDSRLLDTKPLLLHDPRMINAGLLDEKLSEGWLWGMLIIAVLTAFVVTFCGRTRIRPVFLLLYFAILNVPAFTAEIAGFHYSLIPFAAIIIAVITIDTDYELDGRLVFEKGFAAREAQYRNERGYRRRTRKYMLERKLRSDIPRYFKYNANSFAALLTAAAVFTAAALVIPEGNGFDYNEFLEKIQTTGVNIADSVGDALGVNFGTVNDNGYFSYSNYGNTSQDIGISAPVSEDIPVLEAVVDRNDIPVYLRGDIGVSFTGTSWTVIRDEYEGFRDDNGNRYSELLGDFLTDLQYQVLRQRLSYLGYNPDRLLPLQKVSITYRRNTKVVFQPVASYDLSYRSSDFFESFGDYVLRVRSGKGYLKTYESLSLTPSMDNSFMEQAVSDAETCGELQWTLPEGITNEEYSSYVNTYREFIDKAYMKSDTRIQRAVNEMRTGGYLYGDSSYALAEGVCRYFKENFKYSLTVDNGEPGETLENFLYETKEGHCALFATAMTLAMRELGIPARYVTGYVASGEGEPCDPGYRYTLLESDLHAWVEVYFDKVGWLPFDPTAAVSGFGGITDNAEETTDTQTETETETETVTETSAAESEINEETSVVSADTYDEEITPSEDEGEVTTMPPDDEEESAADPLETIPEQKREKSFYEIFMELAPYLVISVIIAAAVIILVMFVRGVKKAEEKAFRGFKRKAPDRATAEMYKLVILLLSKSGISPDKETLTDFAVRADASPLLKGSNVFMTDVMPVFMKCEFGKQEISPVTEEERMAVLKFTAAIYRRYLNGRNAVQKFFTKIMLFL